MFRIHILETILTIVWIIQYIDAVDARIIIAISFGILASGCLFMLHPSMIVHTKVAKMIWLSDDAPKVPQMLLIGTASPTISSGYDYPVWVPRLTPTGDCSHT